MKFGHTFLSHQVPEWQQHYMDYKVLKKKIKAINIRQFEIRSQDLNSDILNDPVVKIGLAEFFFALDSNIEKVDDFYSRKYIDYERRLKKITSVFPSDLTTITDSEESDEFISILLELRNCFRNLKWFAELNKRGFVKILKKLDKKVGTRRQDVYLNSKVYPLSFCNESDMIRCLSIANTFLNKLSLGEEYSPPKLTAANSTDSIMSSISNLEISNNGGPHRLPPPTSVLHNNYNNGTFREKKNSVLDPYLNAIKADDPDLLNQTLIKEYMSPVLAPLKLLLSLLNKSTMDLSYKCIDELLQIIPVLSDSSDISSRNFLHHHVIALGKQNVQKESAKIEDISIPVDPPNLRLLNTFGSDGINSNDSSQGLLYIFENLPTHLKFAILQRDNYRRTPLHYAAQYGLKQVTSIIMTFLKTWGLYNEAISIDDVTHWGDSESLTPLHLAILGKHPKTTQVLLDGVDKKVTSTCPYLLHIATRLNSPELLRSLLACKGMNIDSFEQETTRETPLYVASNLNLKESVRCLLELGANTEIGESSFGWTPIFVASAEGYKEIIELLITYNAKYFTIDGSGWSPREHAALRGHIDIIPLLTPTTFDPYEMLDINPISPKLSPQIKPQNSTSSSIHKVSDNRISSNDKSKDTFSLNHLKATSTSPQNLPQQVSKTVTKFGNSYLKSNESLIMITLGTTDVRDNSAALNLQKVPLSKIHATELDSALSIVISANNLPSQPEVSLSLPLDDNHGSATDPITFRCVDRDPLDTTIFFDIVPTFEFGVHNKGKDRKILGRAVAILRDVYTSVGPNRRSLFNTIKVPILEINTMEVLGTIKFEFLSVTSFEKVGKIPENAGMFWKSTSVPRVIGHRGNGMNSRNKKSLQLGENTVESFVAAASLGASYVEFDVQLTKDDVPVVYHDFLVAETGMDIPMHELTLEQFLNLNTELTKKKDEKEKKTAKDDTYLLNNRRSRSISHGSSQRNDDDDDNFEELHPTQQRMKFTKTWKLKEFKANSRGSTIASSFTTLEELFIKVPKKTGFNMELKYPMLDESQADDIGQIAPDMNYFCDTILQSVYQKVGSRDLIFSSFHPDICMMMAMKQPSFPVLFLTESGTSFMADVRASSLQNAIRFAKNWNLFGIVSEATPIIYCPRLAYVVKASGLACFTYGTDNNDPENAKLEITAGVDAVIVDSVLAVRTGLTKNQETIL